MSGQFYKKIVMLDEELDFCYEMNAPQAGDVLLLNGNGFLPKINRAAQLRSEFSHVAIAIGADLYIDAIAHEGVRIRRIADMCKREAGYTTGKCWVARSRKINDDQRPLLTIAMHHYAKPYSLRSIFKSNINDDSVICSKLIAMILGELGIVLGCAAHQTFPKRISGVCSGSEWRRFPLLEYDLFVDPKSLTSLRKQFTEQTLKLVEPLHHVNIIYKRALRCFSAY